MFLPHHAVVTILVVVMPTSSQETIGRGRVLVAANKEVKEHHHSHHAQQEEKLPLGRDYGYRLCFHYFISIVGKSSDLDFLTRDNFVNLGFFHFFGQ